MEELIKAIQDLGRYSCFDYIQFGVNIVSVVVSAIAVVIAIRIPKKIAKSQNDIDLFEKRYKLYKTVRPLIDFGNKLCDISDNNLIKVNSQTRARHYLMGYIMAKDRDFNERKDIGLNFEFITNGNNEILEYKVSLPTGDNNNMHQYIINFRQHIDSTKSIIELTSFLFSKDIEEELKKLVSVYSVFMYLVCADAELENANISNSHEEEKFKKLDYQTCPMEQSKEEFMRVVKEISEKGILDEIEQYLRIVKFKKSFMLQVKIFFKRYIFGGIQKRGD